MTNDIISLLEAANEELRENGLFVEVMISGGAALSILLPDFRKTFDIDVFIERSNRINEAKSILERYTINDRLKAIAFIPTLDDFSYDDEIKFSNLTCYIASLEDIAIMKLFTNRPKDYDDLVNYILSRVNVQKLLNRCQQYESTYIGNIEFTNYFALKNSLMTDE